MRITARLVPPWRVTLLAAFVVALVFVPAAAGANLVPNPGFETDCSGVPCQWLPLNGASLSRDTVNPHQGSASLRVTQTGTSVFIGAWSGCFSVTGGTTYTQVIWYRTSAIAITTMYLYPLYFPAAGCSGGGSGGGGSLGVSADGAWHPNSTSGTAPANAVSARFQIQFACTIFAPCPPGTTINFDDAYMDVSGALAVTLTSFTATRSGQGVTLRWRTATETDTLGYHVYRQRGSRRVRLTRRLIPALSLARGGISGGSYAYRHRQAPRRTVLRYWLVEVARDGSRSWHGPATVARG